jgi:riboflavin kinase
MRILRGRVVSGIGDFSYWMNRLADHYERKTGLRLFPGTLNLQLYAPFRLPPNVIRLEKEEYGGRVSVNLLPCRVFGRRAFLVRTDANEAGTGHHPHTIVEIATDVSLRRAFGLADGAVVEVELD